MSFADQVREHARRVALTEDAIIETACEAALQGGQHGVLVVRRADTLRLVFAQPDPKVPYGRIHEERR